MVDTECWNWCQRMSTVFTQITLKAGAHPATLLGSLRYLLFRITYSERAVWLTVRKRNLACFLRGYNVENKLVPASRFIMDAILRYRLWFILPQLHILPIDKSIVCPGYLKTEKVGMEPHNTSIWGFHRGATMAARPSFWKWDMINLEPGSSLWLP